MNSATEDVFSVHTDPARLVRIAATALLLAGFLGRAASAQTDTVLYSFTLADGIQPNPNGLFRDGKGNFYGTTQNGGSGASYYGSVFELSLVRSGYTQRCCTTLRG